jgi:threonine synthase
LRYSYLDKLQCPVCGKVVDPNSLQTFCKDCNSPLLASYDLKSARSEIDRKVFRKRPAGMWRWHEILPVRDNKNVVSLGEGDAPLLRVTRLGSQLGLHHLFVKDESMNPTGTFKARGLSAAISKAKELGVKKVTIPTAGNAGGAMAAYAAHCGDLEALVYMPEDTPEANVLECKVTGAAVVLVKGLISDAAALAAEKSRNDGYFDVSTFKEPYRVEGKKIMGYELAESFNWGLPDVILYPTGGGTGLVGMWKAFQELNELGWLESTTLPRMVAVQADGCAPVVKAFIEREDHCDFWENARTIASGLRVPKSFADRLILNDLYDSHGCAVAVSDQEILNAQKELGFLEGIYCAPEGAATLAGLKKLVAEKWVNPEEQIVLFNTGSGLKYIK